MKLLNLLLPKLSCAGKLGACPPNVVRFDFSCLACRLRREYLGKYRVPSYYLKYTYKHISGTLIGDAYLNPDGTVLVAENGGKIKLTRHFYVLIDPVGQLLAWRIAAIRVLDKIMGLTKRNKPFIEFAEFLANYPSW